MCSMKLRCHLDNFYEVMVAFSRALMTHGLMKYLLGPTISSYFTFKDKFSVGNSCNTMWFSFKLNQFHNSNPLDQLTNALSFSLRRWQFHKIVQEWPLRLSISIHIIPQ